jgi:antitoxin (DNA-binding transcriptional repressor) of toxin-antitoxin stability system
VTGVEELTPAFSHVQLEMNLKDEPMKSYMINIKELRASLPELMKRVRRGATFTVIYRSRPAFRIAPIEDDATALTPLEADPLFRAEAVGRSVDGRSAAEHDAVLYGR